MTTAEPVPQPVQAAPAPQPVRVAPVRERPDQALRAPAAPAVPVVHVLLRA